MVVVRWGVGRCGRDHEENDSIEKKLTTCIAFGGMRNVCVQIVLAFTFCCLSMKRNAASKLERFCLVSFDAAPTSCIYRHHFQAFAASLTMKLAHLSQRSTLLWGWLLRERRALAVLLGTRLAFLLPLLLLLPPFPLHSLAYDFASI